MSAHVLKRRRYLILSGILLCSLIAAAFAVSLAYRTTWTSRGQMHTFVLVGGRVGHKTHYWMTDGLPPPGKGNYLAVPDSAGMECRSTQRPPCGTSVVRREIGRWC